MRKDLNRSVDPSYPNNSLPGSKILRGRSNFDRLFKRSTVVRTDKLQFRYRIYRDPGEGCFIGFIASKRLGNAVVRNRIKRLLREVYRMNQSVFSDIFADQDLGFHGVFMAQTSDVTYQSLSEEMPRLMHRVREQVAAHRGNGESVSNRES